MAPTDTSEGGLEALIVAELTGQREAPAASGVLHDRGNTSDYPAVTAYVEGTAKDYDRAHAVDLVQLLAFLEETQPKVVEQLGLRQDGPSRQAFLARLQGEIAKRGIIDVLRRGVKHNAASVDLFYGTPSADNPQAIEQYAQNVFSVTRQLRYSTDATQLALDLAIFINGLPIATFELKNLLTKQNAGDAEQQYKRDRDPRELLFQFKRCLAHFAVDDQEVRFCTRLAGKASWFLPFNKGWNDGAGNPPNPSGLKTDYLWREVLSRDGLTDIIENYAQVVEEKDARTGKKKEFQIYPRYHQLDVVHKLLADAGTRGAGRRYLVQHSAGSGKSNSIAWLAHQLVTLKHDGANVFDSIIVITDRRVLDKQIRDTIKQFAQVGAVVGAVTEGSKQLREFIESGKKIIITTVQKFPFILDEIGNEHRSSRFAIIIDEAHSSQGGKTAAHMHEALGEHAPDDGDDPEDLVNKAMESRKMLANASYFAFTATPKNKTLQMFGEDWPEGGPGKHRPFHSYTMKQAIQEGFILDVLEFYTPVDSYYRLTKKVEDDPEFDTKRAQKRLRHYVESHDHAVRAKAEIMVDHFLEQVIAKQLVGGEARAMVVTDSIARAIQYFRAFQAYLIERKSPYRAIVAFSDTMVDGEKLTEGQHNGFPSNLIPERIREDPYRFLICAEKFQTGYDEPLLHTMYVDKKLSGIKAVQTLSRLNRAHPKKHNTFVLDFQNDADTIRAAFQDYYQTTILSGETDPNKLHDLKADLDAHQIYSDDEVHAFVDLYLAAAERDQLDPILDACRARYVTTLDEDRQVDFKGKAKAFVRTYSFLASVLPFNNADWERLSTFLNFLIAKLPAPIEEDLSKGILGAIDMDSYRVEVQAAMRIALIDEDAEIDPVPAAGGGAKAEAELDRLSNILRSFNEQFGNIEWQDGDKIRKLIAEEIPEKVAADRAYQNAMQHSDKQNARIEHDRALQKVLLSLLTDHTELYKQFAENESFKRWLTEMTFSSTYTPPTP